MFCRGIATSQSMNKTKLLNVTMLKIKQQKNTLKSNQFQIKNMCCYKKKWKGFLIQFVFNEQMLF